ncbi:hypothetical protein HKD37_04G011114 [Glycine soja]
MSRKENLISKLHPRKGTWKIAVRITDMWDVKKHNGRQAIDMVLIDQMLWIVYNFQGVKIGATLWQELFSEFQPKLALGCSYLIQNIKVVDNQSEYKVSPIPYLLYFVKTTSVKEVERLEIPANVHVITEIADIISGIAPRHTLVDFVGVVAEVIERKIVNPAYRVTVKLRDNSDAEILMTLWEDYALQLDDAIEKNHFVRESLVLMLTLAKIKDAKDKYPLSVQNIKNGSKLYVNSDDIAEIRKFRDSLCVPFYVGGLTEEGSGSQSQYTSNSQRGDRDKFLHNAQMVSLGDISRLREGGDEIKVLPECVDDLVGKTLALRFKYRVNMRQSSVMDVSQEEHHIQTLTFKIVLQDEQTIGKSPASCDETSSGDYHPKPSLSQSANYDPGNTAFITPAKKLSGGQATISFWTYNALMTAPPKFLGCTVIYQFQAAFHVDRVNVSPHYSFDDPPIEDDAETDKNGNMDTPYENQNTGYKEVGDPIWQCRHCKAMIWYDERINKDKQTKNPKFALCCGDGKIQMFVLEDAPQPLRQLLFDSNDSQAKNFQQNIRSYNVMFTFTSPGLQLDTRYNTGRGPPTFRVHGQGHHLIGSLLPLANKLPKFVQLYIYDTDNEVNNKLSQNPNKDVLDEDIIIATKNMLDNNNHYAQKFRMARDKLQSSIVSDLKLKLIYDRQSDGRLYNLPNTAEVAALIVGDEHTGYVANPHQNKLIYNEMAYDKEVLVVEFNRCYHSMTDEQTSIFDNIMRVVASQLRGVYFLYGYGGIGKTFMWKTLSSVVRSNGGIVLTVASNGIASLLLPGGLLKPNEGEQFI